MLDKKTLEEYEEIREDVLDDAHALVNALDEIRNAEKNLEDARVSFRDSNHALETFKSQMNEQMKDEVNRINQSND